MAGTCYGFLFLFFVAKVMSVIGQTLDGPNHNKVVVCYVAAWAAYRPEEGKFEQSNLDPGQCTHLVYSFAGLDESNSIKSLDPWQDLEKDYGKNGYNKMVALKYRYPHLKVTLAIGGWNEGSLKYSMMAESQDKRTKFIKSVMRFMEMYKFDGLDLDWEYPARRDGRPQDKENYVALVKELKEAFEPNNLILTAALGAGRDTMEAAYDLTKLSRYLDFIHMMCYDYHGTWDGVVGANAPLRSGDEDDVLHIEYTIKYMLSHGVSPYKMVLGVPLYGRTFLLKDASEKEILFGKTAVQNQGFKGPYTGEAGFLGYNEICKELSTSSWSEHWHEPSSTPYLRDGEKVITYDNSRSIAAKVRLAMDYKLGGIMVWSIDTDDFLGHCEIEHNPFIDFEDRLQTLNEDPIVNEVAERWSNFANSHTRHTRHRYYLPENGKFKLRAPERANRKYPLMNSINEAIGMSLDEDRITAEIEKITRENEIDIDKKPSAANHVYCGLNLIMMVLLLNHLC